MQSIPNIRVNVPTITHTGRGGMPKGRDSFVAASAFSVYVRLNAFSAGRLVRFWHIHPVEQPADRGRGSA